MNDMTWRCDLVPQYQKYRERLLQLTDEVLSTGRYVLGARLAAFESAFASACQAAHSVGVANGTDALVLSLNALGLPRGGEVITTPFTAIPTLSAIVAAGGRPVCVDIDPETLLMDLDQTLERISSKTAAIVPVHLFTQMVDVEALRRRLPRPIPILEDAAQAHGCRLRGKAAGSLGELAAFSFYPTKNLGGYGDGGAIVTQSADLDRRLRLQRNYGKETADRIVQDGVNTRLDELQAAYLHLKLNDLEAMNQTRRDLVEIYRAGLAGTPVRLPVIHPEAVPNYHIFCVQVDEKRDALRAHLAAARVQTDVFYPQPHNLQPAFAWLEQGPGALPQAEAAGRRVLALPMYPELETAVVERICAIIRDFYSGRQEARSV